MIDEAGYCRMPRDIAKTVSDGVEFLNTNTAGGRVKFKTDSNRITIMIKIKNIGKMPHFAYTGSKGLDFYYKQNGIEKYGGSFIPNIEIEDGFGSYQYFENDGISEITLNLPLYSGVTELLIGVNEKSVIEKADEYSIVKPVVFYGSSITQGGCASRPETTYQSFLSQEFDFDFINLGFAGCAKGEDEMIDYIASLDMSVFVLDYDHNAPTSEHLKNTHEKAFCKIRSAHPDIPIIIMPRPKYYPSEEEKLNAEIVKATYENAIRSGDKNVYFVPADKLMALAVDNGTVDNVHPTDFGFYSMAQALKGIFSMIFNIK